MLAPAKLDALHNFIETSTKEELLWISGYLAGLATDGTAGVVGSVNESALKQQTITVVYGTETGNSKKVATMAASKLKQHGIKTKLLAAENFKPEQLYKESNLVISVSTQGEGEPPANAKGLYDFLHATQQSLSHLRYSVLALGSRSYPLFCQAGVDIDSQLRRLHATPLLPIAMCDDDFEPVAEAWITALLSTIQPTANTQQETVAQSKKADGKKSFVASLGVNQMLNDRGSNKEVHHLEFDLAEELLYNPGNAVGIVPENTAENVNRILALLKLHPQDRVNYKGETYEAFVLLQKKLSILHLASGVIKKYADFLQTEIPETRMDLYDLLRIYPMQNESQAQALIDILNPISPRLYTISSSPNAHPGQLHLTAALHTFESVGEQRNGFASSFLTQLKPGQQLEMFLHQQKTFQIPRSDRHLVMIAQGTGISPFRSFMAERDAIGATGHNWLFFGEEDFVADFYYQSEIQNWFETGSLHYVNLAFEKNRNQSLQVHELILKEATRLWQWIETGAYIFVSGEKEPMGKEVENALQQIIMEKKGVNSEDAGAFLKQLAKDGRYAKELY